MKDPDIRSIGIYSDHPSLTTVPNTTTIIHRVKPFSRSLS